MPLRRNEHRRTLQRSAEIYVEATWVVAVCPAVLPLLDGGGEVFRACMPNLFWQLGQWST